MVKWTKELKKEQQKKTVKIFNSCLKCHKDSVLNQDGLCFKCWKEREGIKNDK